MSVREQLKEITDQRGKDAENKVMKSFNDSDEIPEWLLGIHKGSHEEDKKGVDLWVETDVGKIKLQVKSSVRGAEEHVERNKKGDIAVVVVKEGDSLEKVFGEMVFSIKPLREKYLKKRL